LEGLEVSEVMLSEATSITGEARWDSEYYQKKYLISEVALQKHQTRKLGELCNFIKKGIFDLPPTNYIEKGVPLIRTSEIKNPTIDFSTTVYISNEINRNNNKTILLPNDLVFTKIGAYIGDIALLPNVFPQYNFSQNVAGASVKNKHFSAFYLTFFLSNIGKNQILRSTMLSGQGKLELEDIRNYKIPIITDEFNHKIRIYFEKRENCINQSQLLYFQAEGLLLDAIGFKNFRLNTKTTNIKTFKKSFLTTGRLDAEYYQPKYETLISRMKKLPHELLGNLVTIKKSIEPGSDVYSDDGLPFIRVSDYNKFGIFTPEKCLSDSFCAENAELLQSLYLVKETILFSKDGSVGTAFMVRENMRAVTSGAILHLTVSDKTKVSPEYLSLTLNSEIVKMQAERDAGGSVILHWRVNEIENVIVPIVEHKVQMQITALIKKSFALRAESERLLEEAKKLVEQEIERTA
jgi:restriction endonuclease S subunit